MTQTNILWVLERKNDEGGWTAQYFESSRKDARNEVNLKRKSGDLREWRVARFVRETKTP